MRPAPDTGGGLSSPWRLALCVFLAAALHGTLLFGVKLPVAAPQAPPVVAITLESPQRGPLARERRARGNPSQEKSLQPGPLASERSARSPTLAAEAASPARREGRAVATSVPRAAAEPALAAEKPTPLAAPARDKLVGKGALALASAVAEAAGGADARASAGFGNAAPLGADFAYYLDAWRRKVERIGQLNYPAEAKAKGLAGTLRLRVSIAADGALNDVRVVEGSGHAVLDAAALRIVRLAAPYAPFSPTMRAATEVLEIERTWQFRNSRLSA